MKKTILTLLVSLFFAVGAAAQETSTSETGKIYFLRSTGFQGSAVAFKTFIDGEFVCKLNNKKYSIHEVPVGKHECSVQFGGKVSKEKAEKFVIDVQPGKTVYVQIVFESGILINNVYCEEVTENTATSKMQNMKEDTECK
ncbi:DUF2846 domain-containing protein [Flavobacterium turcicum]|uniref:DUF2846 domain-containing protein n=1 Tax=Flavobacterium turcicum TaxID=2764718 RepID=A0ABR7JEV4_9FLAO|nr:DUF2846 domain-containing protein [Flavobacterium turcicum]MBC5862987.1 DUF2846 domain-containing protein [Flavobacterium turcicum]NHL01719.1 DUF2846 domain-containing protein [Flavobacterium turcicum]